MQENTSCIQMSHVRIMNGSFVKALILFPCQEFFKIHNHDFMHRLINTCWVCKASGGMTMLATDSQNYGLRHYQCPDLLLTKWEAQRSWRGSPGLLTSRWPLLCSQSTHGLILWAKLLTLRIQIRMKMLRLEDHRKVVAARKRQNKIWDPEMREGTERVGKGKEAKRRSRSLVAWMWSISQGLTHLSTWALVGDTVWGGYGTSRMQVFAGGSASLGMSFKGSKPQAMPSWLCSLHVVDMWSLSLLLHPLLSHHLHFPSRTISQKKLFLLLWVLLLSQQEKSDW